MSQSDVILALDLGTSSLKALLVAPDGRLLSTARHPYPTAHPKPGFAEQAPEEWWRSAVSAVAEVRGAGKVAAIAVTGQMHGTVLLDERRQPVGPAIIWADERSAREVEFLTARIGAEQLSRLCGSPLFTGVQAATLAWLRAKQPGRWRQVKKLLLPKDWLAFRLTGTMATEPSDAAGTLLFATEGREWAASLLDALALDRDQLPDLIASGSVANGLAAEAAKELGLPAGTPVVLAGGDAPCGAVAAGATDPAHAVVLLSTGAQVMLTATTYAPDPSGRVHVWPASLPGPPRWNRMGATLNAGLAVEWAGKITRRDAPEDILDQAARVPAGAGGLLFLPYLIGERTPLMDPGARGSFVGLRASHGAAELARAVVEGIAFSLHEALNAVAAATAAPEEVLLGGGGARHPLWSRLLADTFGLPVKTLAVADLSAYGAALLAAHHLNWVDVFEATGAWRQIGAAVEPDPATWRRYQEQFAIAADVFRRTRPLAGRLADLNARR